MSHIKYDQLSKIRHLDVANINDRTLSSLTFFADGEWEVWFSTDEGQLLKIIAKPAEAFYFGDRPELDSDLYFPFLDFMVQRASYPEVMKLLFGLKDDLFNLSASLRKVGFLYEQRDKLNHGVSRMVISEIEYIFTTCRSMFDLLQEIIAKLWSGIKLIDENIQKKSLPDTFSKMVLRDNKPISAEEIARLSKIPTPMAEFYARSSDFFCTLRKFRDIVMHGGSSVDTVFVGERDFMVRADLSPFAKTSIWEKADSHPNNLRDLTPALTAVVCETLGDFSEVFGTIIAFPPPLFPRMNYYMRGYFNDHLSAVASDYGRRIMCNLGQA